MGWENEKLLINRCVNLILHLLTLSVEDISTHNNRISYTTFLIASVLFLWCLSVQVATFQGLTSHKRLSPRSSSPGKLGHGTIVRLCDGDKP